MKRTLVFMMATFMTVGLLAGCGGGGKTQITIASISPLSGPQAAMGRAIENGAKMALQEREKDLEAAGYKVKFEPQDDEAKPEVGGQVAQRLAANKNVVAVVGTLNSGVAKPIIPIFAREGNGLVMVSPYNTNPTLTQGNPFFNRIVFKDDYQGPAAARYAAKVLNIKSAYVINDKTEYGKGLADEFAKELKRLGVEVVAEVGLDENKADYGPEATQATAKPVDLIFLGGMYSTAAPLFKQIRAKGFQGAFMGGDGFDSSDLIELGGDAVEKTYFTSVSADYSSGRGKEFHDKYNTTYKQAPPAVAVYAYDSMMLLIENLIDYGKKNGGKAPARSDFATQVRNTKNFPGITSTITFDGNGDNPNSKVFVFVVKGGKVEEMGPAPEN